MYAKKTSTFPLRFCVYAQINQRWKTLLSKIALRNFCACTQKVYTSLLRICVYAQKIQEMTIIVQNLLNNPIVDDLRPAQKLQIWNTYNVYSCTLFYLPPIDNGHWAYLRLHPCHSAVQLSARARVRVRACVCVCGGGQRDLIFRVCLEWGGDSPLKSLKSFKYTCLERGSCSGWYNACTFAI